MPYGRLLRFLALTTIAIAGAVALNDNHYAQALWLLGASIVIFGPLLGFPY